MPLDPQLIKQLLAQPARKRAAASSKLINLLDPATRTTEMWYKLYHSIRDYEHDKPQDCDNPNCLDPNPTRNKVITIINDKRVCRYCFLDGWLAISANQTQLITTPPITTPPITT